MRGLKASLRLCSVCNNVTDVDPCAYCASPTRNQRLVCVVEEPTSIAAVERTRAGYQGVYHVLHGTLSPLHGVGPDQLRTQTLVAPRGARRGGRGHPGHQSHAGRRSDGQLAGSRVARLSGAHHAHRTGVPAGSDIEYADEVTMARAMEGRREV